MEHYETVPSSEPDREDTRPQLGADADSAALEAAANEHMRQVVAALRGFMQNESRWDGRLIVLPWDEIKAKGRTHFDGRVDVCLEYLDKPGHVWPMLINEALHTYSQGVTRSAFLLFPGYEEGPVEALHRLLRPLLLQRLNADVSAGLLDARDARFPFQKSIAALEAARLALLPALRTQASDAVNFYTHLLGVPLEQRPYWFLAAAKQLPPDQRREFAYMFSRMNALLKDKEGVR